MKILRDFLLFPQYSHLSGRLGMDAFNMELYLVLIFWYFSSVRSHYSCRKSDCKRFKYVGISLGPSFVHLPITTLPLQGLDSLREQCRQAPVSCLLPSAPFLTPPGGQLVYAISAHSQDIEDIAVNKDFSLVATCECSLNSISRLY